MSHVKKPAIPQTPKAGEPRVRFDTAVKETLEIVTGRRGAGRVVRAGIAHAGVEHGIRFLPSDATSADIIDKVNEIIEVLQ